MSTYYTGIETTDADQALWFLGHAYDKVKLASKSEGFALQVRCVGEDRFSVAAQKMSASGSLISEPETTYRILEKFDGLLQVESHGHRLDTSHASLLPPYAGVAQWRDRFSFHSTELTIADVDRVAADHFGIPRLRVSFAGAVPASDAAERSWRTLTRYVREIAWDNELFENTLVRDGAFHMLTARLLAVFPNSTTDLSPAHDGSTAVPAALRRAIAYMEEHVAQSIHLPDIAAAARMSPRGLQEAFTRELGLTPSRYLRKLRLDATRTDLRLANAAAGDTVKAIAQRWGFVHAARFAANYYDEYHEYPAETLRR